MKKIFAFTLLAVTYHVCPAFEGQIQFNASKDAVEHNILLSQWKHGPKGAISFDYVYSHKGSTCQFEAKGQVNAVLDAKGKPTAETWVDDDGKPIGRTWIFSGDNESINFPAKPTDLLKFFGFGMQLPADAGKRGCFKNARDIDVVFRNGSVVK